MKENARSGPGQQHPSGSGDLNDLVDQQQCIAEQRETVRLQSPRETTRIRRTSRVDHAELQGELEVLSARELPSLHQGCEILRQSNRPRRSTQLLHASPFVRLFYRLLNATFKRIASISLRHRR